MGEEWAGSGGGCGWGVEGAWVGVGVAVGGECRGCGWSGDGVGGEWRGLWVGSGGGCGWGM